MRRDERGPHSMRLMLVAPGEGTVSAGAQWGRGESVGLPLAPRGARPRRLADRRLRLSRPRHRPGRGARRGQPITRRNIVCFAGAMVMLLVASSWPIHDLGEGYLYSVHMLQHMMLSYFLPPLALLATPEWLLRALIGRATRQPYHVVRWLCHPVVAAVIFNLAVIVSHIPGVVDASLTNGAAALRLAPPRRQHGAADVDARVRTDPRVPHRRRRQDDLPVPAVRRADRAGRLADLRRGRRVSARTASSPCACGG